MRAESIRVAMATLVLGVVLAGALFGGGQLLMVAPPIASSSVLPNEPGARFETRTVALGGQESVPTDVPASRRSVVLLPATVTQAEPLPQPDGGSAEPKTSRAPATSQPRAPLTVTAAGADRPSPVQPNRVATPDSVTQTRPVLVPSETPTFQAASADEDEDPEEPEAQQRSVTRDEAVKSKVEQAREKAKVSREKARKAAKDADSEHDNDTSEEAKGKRAQNSDVAKKAAKAAKKTGQQPRGKDREAEVRDRRTKAEERKLDRQRDESGRNDGGRSEKPDSEPIPDKD